MDIKKNLKQVQEEFRGDEKLLESAFRLEKLYHKYKYVLLVVVVGVVLWVAYMKFLEHKQEKKNQEITAVYNEVLQNPNNVAVLDRLKTTSQELYDLYTYAQALKSQDTQALLKLENSPNSLVRALATVLLRLLPKRFKNLANAEFAQNARLDRLAKSLFALQRTQTTPRNPKSFGHNRSHIQPLSSCEYPQALPRSGRARGQ
ncbi:hypothetical protein HBZC1_18610 [Helicobacter bizzozeronii CIII-1]|uniref:50S ribosomal protein L22 n=1 Tax=Helicobacter bizzozeronii (strain CIII-1) TaxID=1002804 RepID=F8KPV3_HELBC|nr:hypothetical protein [Helicobacter bizzozeronii]CCB80847.1 hypothetical protein HBZC1_18610 [Helicobacter bizzozeronii CIII-1]